MNRYKNINLLFVEDDMNIRKNYTIVFKDIFGDVHEASSYQEAVDRYENNKIDIVIADINLQGEQTGIDFAKYIRKNKINTKIIIISAYSTMENLFESTKLKLVDFLVKPVGQARLLAAIDKAVLELNSVDIKKGYTNINKQYKWDIKKKKLLKNNKEVVLTKLEKKVLNTILSNPSVQLTYDILIGHVWETYDSYRIEELQSIISDLKKKLPPDTIQILDGIGYRYK